MACSKPMNNRRAGSPILSPRVCLPTSLPSALVEIGAGRWRVAIHFRAAPDEKIIRALTAAAAGNAAAKALRFERVAATDWVRESLAGLAPVTAGRFIVHGAHSSAPASRSIASASRSKRRWRSAPAITAPRAAACSRLIRLAKC